MTGAALPEAPRLAIQNSHDGINLLGGIMVKNPFAKFQKERVCNELIRFFSYRRRKDTPYYN
jgi:hypothetical protein